MGVTGGPEAAIDALVRVLHANLYTYLEAEWTAAADATTCPKPYPHSSEAWRWSTNGANVQTFDTLVGEFPSIWVTTLGGQIGANAAPVWGDFNHQLNVQSMIKADSLQVGARQALRFTWAIVRCIQKSLPSLGGTISGSIGYTPQRYSLFRAPSDTDLVIASNLIVLSAIEESF